MSGKITAGDFVWWANTGIGQAQLQQAQASAQAHMQQALNNQSSAGYGRGGVGTPETVDDGSAANGRPEGIGIAEAKVRLGNAAWTKIYNEGGFDPLAVWRNEQNELRARLTAQAEQIGALMCRVEQLEREIVDARVHLGEAITARTDLLVENAALRESRDDWQAMAARADQMRDAMQNAGVENPDQYLHTFPLNALKHSSNAAITKRITK